MRHHTKNQPSAPGRLPGRWIRRLRVRAVTFTTLPYVTPAGIVTECKTGFLSSMQTGLETARLSGRPHRGMGSRHRLWMSITRNSSASASGPGTQKIFPQSTCLCLCIARCISLSASASASTRTASHRESGPTRPEVCTGRPANVCPPGVRAAVAGTSCVQVPFVTGSRSPPRPSMKSRT